MRSPQYRVFVCTRQRDPNDPEGCCCNVGAIEVYKAFQTEIEARQLGDRVQIRRSGYLDRCEAGAVALIYQPKQQFLSWLPTKLQIKLRRWLFPNRHTYGHLSPANVPDIVQSHLVSGQPFKRYQI
jgi:(2Fe-2S) ferredoxin